MRLGDLDALKKAYFNAIEKSSIGEVSIVNLIDNAPTVITNDIYEALCQITDQEFEHSDGFWIITPKGKKIYFQKKPETGEFEWCTDCKEYDQENHCYHRWSSKIRETIEEMNKPQGEWINFNAYYKICPVCNRMVGFDFADPEHGNTFKYCPNCGVNLQSR